MPCGSVNRAAPWGPAGRGRAQPPRGHRQASSPRPWSELPRQTVPVPAHSDRAIGEWQEYRFPTLVLKVKGVTVTWLGAGHSQHPTSARWPLQPRLGQGPFPEDKGAEHLCPSVEGTEVVLLQNRPSGLSIWRSLGLRKKLWPSSLPAQRWEWPCQSNSIPAL